MPSALGNFQRLISGFQRIPVLLFSRTLGLGVGVAIHLGRPLEKAPEAGALAPEKFPELKETDLRHFDAAVGLNAPQQVGAAPRGQAMAFGGIPQKAERVAHGDIINTRRGLGESASVPRVGPENSQPQGTQRYTG